MLALFRLYDLTREPRYKAAMDTLYAQILEQPRTPEGGFWHKKIYPNQMWLDGLYMVEPFYAEYTIRGLGPSSERSAQWSCPPRTFPLSCPRHGGEVQSRDRRFSRESA